MARVSRVTTENWIDPETWIHFFGSIQGIGSPGLARILHGPIFALRRKAPNFKFEVWHGSCRGAGFKLGMDLAMQESCHFENLRT